MCFNITNAFENFLTNITFRHFRFPFLFDVKHERGYFHFVFAVNSQKPDFIILFFEVVNDPCTTAFAFARPCLIPGTGAGNFAVPAQPFMPAGYGQAWKSFLTDLHFLP